METITNFLTDNFWSVISMIAILTVPITTFINESLKTNKVWKQVVSWGTSLAVTCILYFTGCFNIEMPWYIAIPVTGLISGLSANGIYDIPTIKGYVVKYVNIILNMLNKKDNK